MPRVPAPEPWRRAKAYHVRQNERISRRIGVYDCNGKLVAWLPVREAEKKPRPGRRVRVKAEDSERWGAMCRADRVITCVNACRYIPSELLEQQGVVQFAIELMQRACHFGDLQMDFLPEVIADNMERIFEAQFKYGKEPTDDAMDTCERQPITGACSQKVEKPAENARAKTAPQAGAQAVEADVGRLQGGEGGSPSQREVRP
jgi:hypothetical protein